LGKPLRDGTADEVRALAGLLAGSNCGRFDRVTADHATALSSSYRLRAADAIRLATTVGIDADRFITNNQRDFTPAITGIAITYPAVPSQQLRLKLAGQGPEVGNGRAPVCSQGCAGMPAI
jgi:hypothetical protein